MSEKKKVTLAWVGLILSGILALTSIFLPLPLGLYVLIASGVIYVSTLLYALINDAKWRSLNQ